MQRYFELDKNAFTRTLNRVYCWAIELSHSQFEETYYLVNNNETVTIDGKTYQPFPFNFIPPAQTEQEGTKITMSNINNAVAKQMNEVVMSNENIQIDVYGLNIETDDVEYFPSGLFELKDITMDNENVTGTINIRSCLDINLGSMRYTKQNFPNLYK